MNTLAVAPAFVLAVGSTSFGSLLARRRAKRRYGEDLGTILPPFVAATVLSLGFALFANGVDDLVITVLLISGATVCAWTDLRVHRIYESVILLFIVPLFWLQSLAGNLGWSALGAVVLGGGALAVAFAVRGQGFALGDVTLLTLFGAALGLHDGVSVLLMAFIVGGIVSALGLAMRSMQRGVAIAFAPFMLGGLLLWLVARETALL